MQAFRSRFHLVLVAGVLALGLGGVALAQAAMQSTSTLQVTLLDGKLKVSQTSFAPGKLTIVATNKGKLSHGLAIMGVGMAPKHTPTLKSGKSSTLTVSVLAGTYHVWDDVTSRMSHATFLKVTSGGGAASGGGTVTAGSGGLSPGATGGSSGGTGGGAMPGMDPNDPCAGM